MADAPSKTTKVPGHHPRDLPGQNRDKPKRSPDLVGSYPSTPCGRVATVRGRDPMSDAEARPFAAWPAWLAEPPGFIPTAHGDRIPPHLVQAGRHLLAEALDLAGLFHAVRTRYKHLDAALLALIPDGIDDHDGDRLSAVLEAGGSHAICEVFEAMVRYATGSNDAPTPAELREKFWLFAAAPYGPSTMTAEHLG